MNKTKEEFSPDKNVSASISGMKLPAISMSPTKSSSKSNLHFSVSPKFSKPAPPDTNTTRASAAIPDIDHSSHSSKLLKLKRPEKKV